MRGHEKKLQQTINTDILLLNLCPVLCIKFFDLLYIIHIPTYIQTSTVFLNMLTAFETT